MNLHHPVAIDSACSIVPEVATRLGECSPRSAFTLSACGFLGRCRARRVRAVASGGKSRALGLGSAAAPGMPLRGPHPTANARGAWAGPASARTLRAASACFRGSPRRRGRTGSTPRSAVEVVVIAAPEAAARRRSSDTEGPRSARVSACRAGAASSSRRAASLKLNGLR